MNQKMIYGIAKGLVSELDNVSWGEDAKKDGSPEVGKVYVAVNTNKLYICEVAGVWKEYDENSIIFNSETDRFDFFIKGIKVADLDINGKFRVKIIEEVEEF